MKLLKTEIVHRRVDITLPDLQPTEQMMYVTPGEIKLISAFRNLDERDKAWFLESINRTATTASRAAQRCRQNDIELAHRREMEAK